MHGKQGREKHDVYREKWIKLGSILGETVLRNAPNDHWKASKAQPEP